MSNFEVVSIGVQAASKILQIKEPNIYFNKSTDFSNPNISSFYHKSTHSIVFNDKWLDSANELEILTTCFHETRHAYQYYCIQSNSREDQETINTWKREF